MSSSSFAMWVQPVLLLPIQFLASRWVNWLRSWSLLRLLLSRQRLSLLSLLRSWSLLRLLRLLLCLLPSFDLFQWGNFEPFDQSHGMIDLLLLLQLWRLAAADGCWLLR